MAALPAPQLTNDKQTKGMQRLPLISLLTVSNVHVLSSILMLYEGEGEGWGEGWGEGEGEGEGVGEGEGEGEGEGVIHECLS